ncbi:glycosyltransferase family A protein [Vagococcus sp.]|uniref:glycosyltransferase family A protein n=1 Tax=Vagococcus sp. TaxID=1933889 RepID=UPI002FCC3FDC
MVELLISTVDCENYEELLKKINVRTNAIITNQSDKTSYMEYDFNGNRVDIYSLNKKGVGLNRNNCLFFSKDEICVLTDDDMYYVDEYEKLIENAFRENSEADVLIFNLQEKNGSRYKIKKSFYINKLNYTKFGAARIAFKKESILKKRITFSLLFGGGAKHSAGEDTLFLHDCLRSGLVIKAVPITIATLDDSSESTWFKGYNEKLLKDVGACYSEIFKRTFFLRSLYYTLRRRKSYKDNNITFLQCMKLIYQGAKEFRIGGKGKKNSTKNNFLQG